MKSFNTVIADAWLRFYSDSGQLSAYVQWGDSTITVGSPKGVHMNALLKRAAADGVHIRYEEW